MATPPVPAEVAALLGRADAALAALDDDGFRVPWPASLPEVGDREVPLPPTRSTLLDVVVPADGLPVTVAWEALVVHGRGSAPVRLREDPDQRSTVVFLDARESAGVVLAAFVPDGRAAAEVAGESLPDALRSSQRPRSASVVKSVLGAVISVDERMTLMTGWTPEELLGRRSTELVHPEDLERALRAWLEMRGSGHPARTRVRHACADGSWRWVELENRLSTDADGQQVVVCDVLDVSEEMAAHESVRRSARLFRLLAEAMPVGVLRVEAGGRTGFANARALHVLGVTGAGEEPTALVPDVAALLALVAEHDRPALAAVLREALRSGTSPDGPDGPDGPDVPVGPPAPGSRAVEVDLLPTTGTVRSCRVEWTPVSDEEGAPGALLCLSDTTDQRRAVRDLHERATVDALTGCANRAGVQSALVAALDDAARGAAPAEAARTGVGVLFLDLDGFKAVNDELGHAAGDELLAEVGARLRAAVRSRDAVGRLGGDEFLLVLTGVDAVLLADIGERVVGALTGDVPTAAGTARLGASCGAVLALPGEDATALLARADAAMYAHKRSRRAERR